LLCHVYRRPLLLVTYSVIATLSTSFGWPQGLVLSFSNINHKTIQLPGYSTAGAPNVNKDCVRARRPSVPIVWKTAVDFNLGIAHTPTRTVVVYTHRHTMFPCTPRQTQKRNVSNCYGSGRCNFPSSSLTMFYTCTNHSIQGVQWVAEAVTESNKPAVASMSLMTPALDAINSAVKGVSAKWMAHTSCNVLLFEHFS